MNRQDFLSMISKSFQKWQSNDSTLRAGALTFFVITPLPGLTLIVIEVLALIYGREQAFQQLIHQISVVFGSEIGNLFSVLLQNAQSPFTSIFGALVSIAFTISGAIGAFSVLKKSANAIWEKKPVQIGRGESIRKYFISFLLVTVVGLTVIAWVSFSSVFIDYVVRFEPFFGSLTSLFLRIVGVVVSFGLGVLLFAIAFRQIPEVKVEWRDVLLAAVITSFVFTLLNSLFSIYVSFFPRASLAGTAGALMLLFFWLYLTNLFVLFGIQFSRVYAETKGSLSKAIGENNQQKEVTNKMDVKNKKKMDVEIKLRGKIIQNVPEKPESKQGD